MRSNVWFPFGWNGLCLRLRIFYQPNESMLKMYDARMLELSQPRPLYLMQHIIILPGHKQ